MSGVSRVGIVGAGYMAKRHVAALLALGMEVGVYSRSARHPGVLSGLPRYQTYDDLLDAVGLVVVATPTPSHRELVERAASAGVHVMCEKPLSLGSADAAASALACERAGVRLFPAHVVRHMQPYAAARAAARVGEIGTVRMTRLSRTGGPPTWATWFADPAVSGGVQTDLMIHDLDVARWIAGEVVAVDAAAPSGASTSCAALLRHASGAVSCVTASWEHVERPFSTAWEVVGAEGVLDERWWTQHQPATPPGDAHAIQMADVLDAIATGRAAVTEAADGVAAVALAEAVRESVRTGRTVRPRSMVRADTPDRQQYS
ncbi:Gfo/Idh/MocA family protein [Krasilnikoviella flava]|uniref:Myo-inositol 2-dehydrogenase / D-chiro-inositol 1-dehydrogenase n=1 Tax=Krasilnikoviella flava TaxID=526729 RepID=A0A1T5LAX4_9MICO|nr:Gfo/Idh/MocA family oxidoreductase [Krasilnikoviella flava]SKC72799.1 myo-inositol 2-dehydrogenase / D-chiro-inositol 1-dehydrogenase [Krasilnikoviella flava]